MTPKSPFKPRRDSAQDARLLAKKLWPDAKTRRLALEILRDDIARAHEIDPACWGVSLAPNRLRLNVGRGAVWTLERQSLALLNHRFSAENLETGWPEIQSAHEREVVRRAREFGDSNFQNPAWRVAHSSGVLEFLREEFGEIPSPIYVQNAPKTEAMNLGEILARAVLGAELSLPDDYLAAFFLGLQTRGFVLLSGPSGVGKSRLALALAPFLGAQSGGNGGEAIALGADFRATGRIVLPPNAAQMANGGAASARCEGADLPARIEDGALVLRGAARRCVLQTFGDEENVWLEVEIDDAGKPLFILSRAPSPTTSTTLFLPVRADWNDARALLGYANPLLNRYEWTPFLRFLLEAQRSFESDSPRAHFVILDEMNLARVEFFLGDLLSVLESGRDENGQTREALTFEADAKLGGEKPPARLPLPPNLYFVGTLNDDETTHALSPKVLDRAFVLESPRADFENYPPVKSAPISANQARFLAQKFGRGGQFLGELKPLVARELETEPKWRAELQALQNALESEGFDFGFRVFDEIVAFVALARESELLSSEAAFDAILGAKILPRIRGSAMRVESALAALEAWAKTRELPVLRAQIARKKRQIEREGFI